MRFRARSADVGGQCSAAVRSLLEKAAERQGGAATAPPIRGEKTARRARKRRSEIDGAGDELERICPSLLLVSVGDDEDSMPPIRLKGRIIPYNWVTKSLRSMLSASPADSRPPLTT